MTHPYKEILIAIANGEQVEWQGSNGEWQSQSVNTNLAEIAAEIYGPKRYRVKPRTININGIEVPEPVREPLKNGTKYWTLNRSSVIDYIWDGDNMDQEILASGWVHLTKEAAEAHHRALVSFTQRGEA